jgi:hypothetical protein
MNNSALRIESVQRILLPQDITKKEPVAPMDGNEQAMLLPKESLCCDSATD